LFAGDAGKVDIALPLVAIEEVSYSPGKHLTVIGVGDGALPGATYTLVAAQRPSGQAAKDLDKHIVCEAIHCFPLIGGLLHLEEQGHQPPKRQGRPAVEFHQ
jgi:hypothetical protein